MPTYCNEIPYECPDIGDSALTYIDCEAEVVVPIYRYGCIRSKPLDEDPRCILKTIHVFLRCIDSEPGCEVTFLCKQWCVIEKEFSAKLRRACIVIERAELDCCTELVDIVKNDSNCECDPFDVPISNIQDVPTITTHIKSEKEIRNDAEWCYEYRSFCFDRDELGLEPGSVIIWQGREFTITKTEQGRPCMLLKVEARGSE